MALDTQRLAQGECKITVLPIMQPVWSMYHRRVRLCLSALVTLQSWQEHASALSEGCMNAWKVLSEVGGLTEQVANVVLRTPQRRLEGGGNAPATKPGTAAVTGRACTDAKRSAAGEALRGRPSMTSAVERGASKSRAF